MAKKLPLYLSTLTILTSALLAPNVGALGEEDLGPWTFDELFAANTELEAMIAERCNDPFYLSPCTNEIMQENGNLYEIGLQKFRYNQLNIRSLDFRNGELEYYLKSEDTYRKTHLWEPYTDYLSKLVIVQVENGYEGDYFTDIRNGNENPHLRILYNGTKATNEISLLPFDQLATLQINTPTLDPRYEKGIKLYYEDTNGDSGMYTIEFTEVFTGNLKYYTYIDAPNPYPYLKDFSYNAGYEAGLNTGYGSGYDDGFSDGYSNGYNEGQNDGYDSGRNDGYNNGLNNGYNNGYNDGLTNGYNDGFWPGYDNGFQDGYNEGYTNGRIDNFIEGYTSGYADGYDRGVTDSNTQNEIDTNNTEDSSNDSDNSDIDIVNTTDVADTTTLSINTTGPIPDNNAINITTTPKLFPRTPNTGDAEHETEQGNKINFPWWLGAILGLNLTVLIWLFWPDPGISKKPKK